MNHLQVRAGVRIAYEQMKTVRIAGDELSIGLSGPWAGFSAAHS